MQILECAVPHNHFESGCSGKHTLIKVALYQNIFHMHTEMPITVKVTIVMAVHGINDLALFLCSSVTSCVGGNVKMCCCCIVSDWVPSFV